MTRTGTILDTIVDDTRLLVAKRSLQVPLSALSDRVHYGRTPHRLDEALRRPEDGPQFIAEIKKASPSEGLIRPNFDVPDLARQYAFGGAAALSVLTEQTHFKGHPDDLTAARSAVDLPILRKDFIIDPYQIHEAKSIGADAILLIASILDAHQLLEYHEEAQSLGLSVLVEVHDPQELDRVPWDVVSVLGVNNRNLKTFTVDLTHAASVFAEVSAPVVRVAESGIGSGQDVAALFRSEMDAMLVGTRLMREASPGAALFALNQSAREELGLPTVPRDTISRLP